MKKVGIIMGSDSDLPVVSKAIDTLKNYGVPFEVHVFDKIKLKIILLSVRFLRWCSLNCFFLCVLILSDI